MYFFLIFYGTGVVFENGLAKNDVYDVPAALAPPSGPIIGVRGFIPKNDTISAPTVSAWAVLKPASNDDFFFSISRW